MIRFFVPLVLLNGCFAQLLDLDLGVGLNLGIGAACVNIESQGRFLDRSLAEVKTRITNFSNRSDMMVIIYDRCEGLFYNRYGFYSVIGNTFYLWLIKWKDYINIWHIFRRHVCLPKWISIIISSLCKVLKIKVKFHARILYTA